MGWIEDNLQILATLGSAVTLYIFVRIGARKEAKEIKAELKSDMADLKAEFKNDVVGIKNELSKINDKLHNLDTRVARLEGRFEERHHWYPEIREK